MNYTDKYIKVCGKIYLKVMKIIILMPTEIIIIVTI